MVAPGARLDVKWRYFSPEGDTFGNASESQPNHRRIELNFMLLQDRKELILK